MLKYLNMSIYFILILSFIDGQHIIPANPFNLLFYEQSEYVKDFQRSYLLRPLIYTKDKPIRKIQFRNEFFFSDNGPNLENMGNRWIGKGLGYFTSVKFYYINRFIIFIVEPYYLGNQNLHNFEHINRSSPYDESPDLFNVLNDNRSFSDEPYIKYGFRESALLLHYNDISFGLSNANMWWGPGIHSSLTMTNNTTGFPHLFLGTINEKRINNVGINIRYIFAKLDKVVGKPYYSALASSIQLYTQPIISIGFSRNYISGGLPTDRPFTYWDAAKLPFEWLFIDSKIENYPEGWDAHDRWDQTIAGFIKLNFPNSGLQIFLELGTDDHRQNFSDLRSHPEHNSASILGIRKYGLFNKKNLFTGFEYANIKRSFTHKFRGGGHWWWSHYYDYSTYDGRRWAAHSGSDSDDFYLFVGFDYKNIKIIPGFNYERHGIDFGAKPEVKMEFRLDLRFIYNKYDFNIYFEHELFNNLGFINGKRKNSNIIWIGFEKDLFIFDSQIFNKK